MACAALPCAGAKPAHEVGLDDIQIGRALSERNGIIHSRINREIIRQKDGGSMSSNDSTPTCVRQTFWQRVFKLLWKHRKLIVCLVFKLARWLARHLND